MNLTFGLAMISDLYPGTNDFKLAIFGIDYTYVICINLQSLLIASLHFDR